MATDMHISQLIINKLTKAKYDEADVAGNINDNELYFITDDEEGQNLVVDDCLSDTSTNPVQNKIVTDAINNLSGLVGDTPVAKQISEAVNQIDTEIPVATSSTLGGVKSGTDITVDSSGNVSVEGKAPTSHASTSTTYGAGSGDYYGHVKLSDSTSSTSGVSDGIAATPAAVKAAYDLTVSKQDKISGVQGQLVGFDANGDAVAQDKPSYTASEVGALATEGGVVTGNVALIGDFRVTGEMCLNSTSEYGEVLLYGDTAPLYNTGATGEVVFSNATACISNKPIYASGFVAMNKQIKGVAAPTAKYDAANKEYVDAKQDTISGTQGQVVGFDENGNAVAQDASTEIFIATFGVTEFQELTTAYEAGKCIFIVINTDDSGDTRYYPLQEYSDGAYVFSGVYTDDDGYCFLEECACTADSGWGGGAIQLMSYDDGDQRYLPLPGGTLTGDLTLEDSNDDGSAIFFSSTLYETIGSIEYNAEEDRLYFNAGTSAFGGSLDVAQALDVGADIICAGSITGDTVHGAVYNDYAEYRHTVDAKPGQCVLEVGNGDLRITQERLIPGCSIVSDTFGFAIGETDDAKTPLAVAGRVLVYTDAERREFKAGDAVCSGSNGTVSKMTRAEIREYPDCIIGIVSEIPEYETWGTNNVAVDGRIWIKLR